MARYKHIDTSPRFIAVDLQRQLLPGAFEHALNHLLDHEIDLTGFDARFCNDITGATAYPPTMLLKAMEDMLADETLITVDAGYHSEANLRILNEMGVSALIADNNMRGRQPR